MNNPRDSPFLKPDYSPLPQYCKAAFTWIITWMSKRVLTLTYLEWNNIQKLNDGQFPRLMETNLAYPLDLGQLAYLSRLWERCDSFSGDFYGMLLNCSRHAVLKMATFSEMLHFRKIMKVAIWIKYWNNLEECQINTNVNLIFTR